MFITNFIFYFNPRRTPQQLVDTNFLKLITLTRFNCLAIGKFLLYVQHTLGRTVKISFGRRVRGKCVLMKRGDFMFSASSTEFPIPSFHEPVSLPISAVNLDKHFLFLHIATFEKICYMVAKVTKRKSWKFRAIFLL